MNGKKAKKARRLGEVIAKGLGEQNSEIHARAYYLATKRNYNAQMQGKPAPYNLKIKTTEDDNK